MVCPQSLRQKIDTSEVEELQAGVKQCSQFFTSAIFQQAGKAALNNPALGHNLGGVQLAAPVKQRCGDGLTSPYYHRVRIEDFWKSQPR